MTRFLSCAIGLLLLSCGVVEAGEFGDIVRNHQLIDKAGDVLVTCDDAMQQRWTPCEQKLKEAMKAVVPYLSKSSDIEITPSIYISPAGQLRQAAEEMDRKDAAVEQFLTVMEECAK